MYLRRNFCAPCASKGLLAAPGRMLGEPARCLKPGRPASADARGWEDFPHPLTRGPVARMGTVWCVGGRLWWPGFWDACWWALGARWAGVWAPLVLVCLVGC